MPPYRAEDDGVVFPLFGVANDDESAAYMAGPFESSPTPRARGTAGPDPADSAAGQPRRHHPAPRTDLRGRREVGRERAGPDPADFSAGRPMRRLPVLETHLGREEGGRRVS